MGCLAGDHPVTPSREVFREQFGVVPRGTSLRRAVNRAFSARLSLLAMNPGLSAWAGMGDAVGVHRWEESLLGVENASGSAGKQTEIFTPSRKDR